jgi:hyperosmotically inducible periplasmic protein
MRMKDLGRFSATAILGAVMAASWASAALVAAEKPKSLDRQVRHELAVLPFYGVFDVLTYTVSGDKVTLMGQVSRPTLKTDAENAIRRLPGVTSVDNRIRVLPLSSFDDRIRLGALRAIYGNSALARYSQGAVPAIHIIVRNGRVTLEGVVDRQMDKNIAGIVANGIPGVFSVTNNLRVGS